MKSRPKTAAPRLNSVKPDYAGIVKQIVDEEYLKGSLEWVTKIGEKERQGLKIIQAVMKHKGLKKFRNKPKESIMELAHKSINSNSLFNLNRENMEKFRQEYKKSMYKSAYGVAFGRKETDVADTNILKYKNFDQLPWTRVLNKTAKSFLARWTQLGDDNSYISMTILVLKGIYTYWRQTVPNDTVSHLMHGWYAPHDKVNLSRMDKVGKSLLLSRIKRAEVARPQTAGSNIFARKKSDLIRKKVSKKDKGMDEVIANRKKFLLRGNGNITGFYDAPEGIVSTYQATFKACKSTKAIPKTNAFNYQSSIMTITPDPSLFIKQIERQNRLKDDINKTTMKFSGNNSVAKHAINRALFYQQEEDLSQHINTPGNNLRLMQANAGQQYRNRGVNGYTSFMNNSAKTPMPVRIQNLVAPEAS